MDFVLTPELLAAICGVVLTIVFSYIPGLSGWYAGLGSEVKRLIMLGLIVLVSVVIYFGTCGGVFQSGITCDKPGLLQLITIVITAIIANQGVYSITPQTEAVKAAKLQR